MADRNVIKKGVKFKATIYILKEQQEKE